MQPYRSALETPGKPCSFSSTVSNFRRSLDFRNITVGSVYCTGGLHHSPAIVALAFFYQPLASALLRAKKIFVPRNRHSAWKRAFFPCFECAKKNVTDNRLCRSLGRMYIGAHAAQPLALHINASETKEDSRADRWPFSREPRAA